MMVAGAWKLDGYDEKGRRVLASKRKKKKCLSPNLNFTILSYILMRHMGRELRPNYFRNYFLGKFVRIYFIFQENLII